MQRATSEDRVYLQGDNDPYCLHALYGIWSSLRGFYVFFGTPLFPPEFGTPPPPPFVHPWYKGRHATPGFDTTPTQLSEEDRMYGVAFVRAFRGDGNNLYSQGWFL